MQEQGECTRGRAQAHLLCFEGAEEAVIVGVARCCSGSHSKRMDSKVYARHSVMLKPGADCWQTPVPCLTASHVPLLLLVAHTRVILPGPTCSYQPVNPDGMASLTRDPALIFGVST